MVFWSSSLHLFSFAVSVPFLGFRIKEMRSDSDGSVATAMGGATGQHPSHFSTLTHGLIKCVLHRVILGGPKPNPNGEGGDADDLAVEIGWE
ncbi:hypothetical protein PIB30_064982 [Stylosanthes scabra]|uniref:Secreted protein n=1 Tax=Stylosanthes scabra TaxID=79078 RepID=A0ABU6ZKJ3_9FABA|nr:hypothetical protein [Stylosanthes scabra]